MCGVCMGFVLNGYGKSYRYGNDFHEGRSLYLQIPKNRRNAMPYKATWGRTRAGQESQGHKARAWPSDFIGVFEERNE